MLNHRESKWIGIERLRMVEAKCAIQHQALAIVDLVRTGDQWDGTENHEHTADNDADQKRFLRVQDRNELPPEPCGRSEGHIRREAAQACRFSWGLCYISAALINYSELTQ